jgi:hypothetical protein
MLYQLSYETIKKEQNPKSRKRSKNLCTSVFGSAKISIYRFPQNVFRIKLYSKLKPFAGGLYKISE